MKKKKGMNEKSVNRKTKNRKMGTRQKNKVRTFEIPKEFIGTFFSQLEDSDLEYALIEIDEENEELIIEISYSQEEREDVMNLIELLDEYVNDEDVEDN